MSIIAPIRGLTYTRPLEVQDKQPHRSILGKRMPSRESVSAHKTTTSSDSFLTPRTPPLSPRPSRQLLLSSSLSSSPLKSKPHYASSTSASSARSSRPTTPKPVSARRPPQTLRKVVLPGVDQCCVGRAPSTASSSSAPSAVSKLRENLRIFSGRTSIDADTPSIDTRLSSSPSELSTRPASSLSHTSIDKARISAPVEPREQHDSITRWARRAEYEIIATQDAVRSPKPSMAARAKQHVRSRSRNSIANFCETPWVAPPARNPVRTCVTRGQKSFYHAAPSASKARPAHPLEQTREEKAASTASIATIIWRPSNGTTTISLPSNNPTPPMTPAHTSWSSTAGSQPSKNPFNTPTSSVATSERTSITNSADSRSTALTSCWYDSSDDESDNDDSTHRRRRHSPTPSDKKRRLFKRLVREKISLVDAAIVSATAAANTPRSIRKQPSLPLLSVTSSAAAPSCRRAIDRPRSPCGSSFSLPAILALSSRVPSQLSGRSTPGPLLDEGAKPRPTSKFRVWMKRKASTPAVSQTRQEKGGPSVGAAATSTPSQSSKRWWDRLVCGFNRSAPAIPSRFNPTTRFQTG